MMKNAVSDIDFRHSTEWYKELIDSVPLGIYRTTLEGKLVFCNRAFAELFAFKKVSELIGYPVINLYRNQKDRGLLIQSIVRDGSVKDLPLWLQRQDGVPVVCAVSARAVLDDDGVVVYLDGTIRDITDKERERHHLIDVAEKNLHKNDFIFILNLRGDMVDMSMASADLLGLHKEVLKGRSLFEFMEPHEKFHFPLFISDLVQSGEQEGIFTLISTKGRGHCLGFHALLEKGMGRQQRIKIIAQDATGRMQQFNQRLRRERLLGVMEMAGGVAHELNQPLTIMSNLLHEILSDSEPHDKNFKKIRKIDTHLQKLNETVRKIGSIKKYEAMEYVAGVKIVDIDKASQLKRGVETT